ncbi:MAG: hypothetical protein F4X87_09820 [Chloroflexi bacterium]|nr:hypothetical protein [Chloroflexota bacterium]
MAVRRSYTAIVERNVLWQGEFASEPYEAAWASEAIFFVRALRGKAAIATKAYVQISADGMHWVNEGTTIEFPQKAGQVTFCKVKHFGGFLRIRGKTPRDTSIVLLVSLALKE